MAVCISKCNSSYAFWHIYKIAEKVGSLKKRPETALGALLGASEKESRYSKVFSKEAPETSD